METRIAVKLIVEDALSDAVMRRLLTHSSRPFDIHSSLLTHGVSGIKRRIPVFLNACSVIPHVVLTDLDTAGCAPELLADWRLTRLPAELLFRVAVREVEAWLLADAEGVAEFLQVPKVKIPVRPETLADPKQALINIARRSRSRRLAAEIVPPVGSRAQIGPLYNQRLGRFAGEAWSVDRAAQEAPSLARTLMALDRFVEGLSRRK